MPDKPARTHSVYQDEFNPGNLNIQQLLSLLMSFYRWRITEEAAVQKIIRKHILNCISC
jgi:hypothetical protein